MANYIKSGSCPVCGSSDARAEYSDGTHFCFSCNTFTGAGLKDRLKPRRSNEKAVKVIDTSQWQYSLPEVATAWLNRYELTKDELSGFRWNPALTSKLWDGNAGALAMPLWQHGRVVCVSYRLFDNDKPKSITIGYRPYITISNIATEDRHMDIYGRSPTVIVVEDYISALKVSRLYPCIPLLGSSMPDDAILRLSKGYRSVFYWLDADKCTSALKMAQKAALLGMETRTIYTEEDPKEYTDGQITEIVETRLFSNKNSSLNNFNVFDRKKQ